MLNLKKYFIILILLFCVQNSCIAVEINFESVLSQSKENSYELKIADTDTEISKQDIKTSRSNYFPTLKAGFNTEYAKNLSGTEGVTTVGDTVLSSNTRYQSLFNLNLTYNLYDFGIRKKQLEMAKENARMYDFLKREKERELKFHLIEVYGQALNLNKQIVYRTTVDNTYKDILELKHRLYKSGEISNIELLDQKTKMKENNNEILALKSKFAEVLEELSYYTKQNYNVDDIKVDDFEDQNIVPVSLITHEQTLEYQIYTSQIKQKQLELKIIKNQRLPQFVFYSKYNLYGSDKNSYLSAYDVSPSIWSAGIGSTLPVFDGFKNKSQQKKTELEIQKLEYQRDQAVDEFNRKLNTLNKKLAVYKEQKDNYNLLLSEIKQKKAMSERLLEQKLISKLEIMDLRADLTLKEMELEKIQVETIMTIEGINALTSAKI